MTSIEPQPAAPSPQRPRFQFRLRTLLLLPVVLGSSLAVFGAWGIVVFALAVVLTVGIQQTKTLSSPAFVALVAFCLICFLLVLLPLLTVARDASRLASCRRKLRNIALALQCYHRANGCFPPAYIADKNGKPMHSWRVLILPYMDYRWLHEAYDFTQPWDGPKNKKLVGIGLADYVCPSDPSNSAPGQRRQAMLP